MTDDTKALVERLRCSVRAETPLGHRETLWLGADTIERLERELADRDALAAECARLREALRACVDLCDLPVDDDYSERCHAAWKQARAVLAEKKEDSA